jgi:hypothetical protein
MISNDLAALSLGMNGLKRHGFCLLLAKGKRKMRPQAFMYICFVA